MASEPVSRKLTTIFAADVVGFSTMMADDEEATLEQLRAYRIVIDRLIGKHDGRIFNTAGDAVLAEFGSAVEAVRCAVSIQEDLSVRNAQLAENRQMWFRIGINVGDVMLEGDDLFGDGVNVAARLEGLASPGGICISGSTFDQVKNKLSVGFTDIGPQAVKNIPEPVPAFRLVPGKVTVRGEEKSDVEQSPKTRGRRTGGLIGLAAAVLLGSFAAYQFLAIPAAPEFPFDGKWSVRVHSRTGCRTNESTGYPIDVVNGVIDEPHQRLPKKGTVSDDGAFRIEVFAQDGRPMNTQEGKITGDTGTGQFLGARPSCRGEIEITRVK